ncbi:MAG: glycerol-3-phosphate acyltransferase [Solibacterales bacterium]|nr:glycerol-3-phosphate acyltransferase [Bryobacterales bacterium]|tara:strand:- start:16849 stop:17433 length:585 start_codon:yes stop_codon:yes gene_type:complete
MFEPFYLLIILGCFLAGSIPFAVVAMRGSGVDIREVGSGNPGFNNVLRVSKPRAVIALLGDMGKGFLPVWWCASTGAPEPWTWMCGFATVFGHCYSPWLKFNGGKGVATSAGVMLVLYPQWAAIALGFFLVIRIILGRWQCPEAGMIGSISTWVFFTILMVFYGDPMDIRNAGLMTLFIAWRHQKNFRNLWSLR